MPTRQQLKPRSRVGETAERKRGVRIVPWKYLRYWKREKGDVKRNRNGKAFVGF